MVLTWFSTSIFTCREVDFLGSFSLWISPHLILGLTGNVFRNFSRRSSSILQDSAASSLIKSHFGMELWTVNFLEMGLPDLVLFTVADMVRWSRSILWLCMFIIIFYIFKWCQILCKSTYNSHVKIEGFIFEIDYAGELISIISYLISVNVSFISSSSLISLLFIMSAFFWHKSSPRLSKACCLQYSILKYKK